ncbi:FeoA family protein [Cellulomonas palmilytica]|uniref:FeoA family protein n=1 Tax=Cellulomonas palmilytica TaxID=2608402 RepID=UPI001F2B2E61|nr:FeoA domain-containing protein [Cellulomonas palmilytica]UJP40885.1 FeoA domain-containing protein [Cellulomonas palmilytica]
MDLAEGTPGDAARAVRIDLDTAMRRRCRGLGLAPGSVTHVTHRGGLGGREVGLGTDRFALDSWACVRRYVSPVQGLDPA